MLALYLLENDNEREKGRESKSGDEQIKMKTNAKFNIGFVVYGLLAVMFFTSLFAGVIASATTKHTSSQTHEVSASLQDGQTISNNGPTLPEPNKNEARTKYKVVLLLIMGGSVIVGILIYPIISML